jgi:AraC-like DNA-binding protein
MTLRAISQARSLEGPQLEHYPEMHTQSPDEARHRLRSAYGLQDLSVIGGKSEFFAQINHKPIKDISLTYCAFGGTVELEFPQSNFARQLFCFSGNGVVQAGKTAPYLQVDDSLPLPIGQPAKFRYTKDFRQIVLRIGEAALIKKLTALLGSEPSMPIHLDWSQQGGEEKIALRNLVMYLAQEIHPLEKCGVFCPVISELEQAIVTTFLYANGSNYSHLLRANPKDVGPWQVRAVEDYILSNWNEPIDMLQLVKITGASARSIFQAFARTRGYSPKTFLKRTRLTHARSRLQSSDPDTSVTAIALSCGFHNLGHFARDYRAYFGELPSETLAKQRIKRPLRPHI